MKIGPGVRAAIVAGVTAGITVSLMLMGGHGSVTVHNTAADAPVDETTSTTVPDTTSTTLAPTTTTTVAPATTTTTLSLEQRLARLEATTTTTTTAPAQPKVNFYYEGSNTIAGSTPGHWYIGFQETEKGPFPGLKITATVNTVNGPQEFVAVPQSNNQGGTDGAGNYYVDMDASLLPSAPVTYLPSTSPVNFLSMKVTWGS